MLSSEAAVVLALVKNAVPRYLEHARAVADDALALAAVGLDTVDASAV